MLASYLLQESSASKRIHIIFNAINVMTASQSLSTRGLQKEEYKGKKTETQRERVTS